MPIYTNSTTLGQIIGPGLAVRTDGEGCINITEDSVRVRAVSETKDVYLDYTLPTDVSEFYIYELEDTFWLFFEWIKGFLGVVGSGSRPVTLVTPAENPGSKIRLESEKLRYQFRPIDSRYTHSVDRSPSDEIMSECEISHGAFALAVRVANLLGNQLRVELNPRRQVVEFSVNGDTDEFRYQLSTEQISHIHGAASTLTISIKRLRDLITVVPDASTVSLQFTGKHLIYEIKFPIPGANLQVYIAKLGDEI